MNAMQLAYHVLAVVVKTSRSEMSFMFDTKNHSCRSSVGSNADVFSTLRVEYSQPLGNYDLGSHKNHKGLTARSTANRRYTIIIVTAFIVVINHRDLAGPQIDQVCMLGISSWNDTEVLFL